MLLQAKVAQLQQKLEAAKQAQAASLGREQAPGKTPQQAPLGAPSIKAGSPATWQPVQTLRHPDASKPGRDAHSVDFQRRHLAPLNGRANTKSTSPSCNLPQSRQKQSADQLPLPDGVPQSWQQKDRIPDIDHAGLARQALHARPGGSHPDPSSTGNASSPREHAASTSAKPAAASSSAEQGLAEGAGDMSIDAEAARAAAGATLVTLVGSEDPDDPDWLLALALQEDEGGDDLGVDAPEAGAASDTTPDADGSLPDEAGPACIPDGNQDSQLSSLSGPTRSSENADRPALRPSTAQHGIEFGAAYQPYPGAALDLVIDLDYSPGSDTSMDVDRQAAASDAHPAGLTSRPCGDGQPPANATLLLDPSAARPAFAAAGGALGSFRGSADAGARTFIRQGADGRGGRSKSLLQPSSRLVPLPAKVRHSCEKSSQCKLVVP